MPVATVGPICGHQLHADTRLPMPALQAALRTAGHAKADTGVSGLWRRGHAAAVLRLRRSEHDAIACTFAGWARGGKASALKKEKDAAHSEYLRKHNEDH